jgi:hypothetical protein
VGGRGGYAGLASAGLALAVGGAAQAQSNASNNQAYVNQLASTVSPQLVTNQASLLQEGSSNRLGTMENAVRQSATDGPSNVFTATQSGATNLVGFTAGGAGTLPLLQAGNANRATLSQTGQAHVIGGLSQTNLVRDGEGNTLSIVQAGQGNYVLEVLQRNNGRGTNTASIVQNGEFNGYRTGTVFGDAGNTAAINGTLALMQRAYIGAADAQLQFFFTSNGASAYYGPDDRPGAALHQHGGRNVANLSTSGTDNSFLVQQNSTTTREGGGNRFDWSASGSNNFAYALQVGTNLASNMVTGDQNAFLVYQAGETGAGGNGYGNLVTWQQGEKAGDIQNFAEIVQLGFNNTVTGSQLGSLNVFRSYQRGSANVVAAISVGSGNVIDVVQIGSGNRVTVTQGVLAPRP